MRLDKKSPDMDTLRQVVTEPRFLNQFDFFRNFRHTGALEGFNNHILMYAPKRHSYRFHWLSDKKQARCHRPQPPSTSTRESRSELRHSLFWKLQQEEPALETQDEQEKNYSYKTDLQLLTFQLKQSEGEGGLKRKTPMDIDDPTLISSTIAKRPCPPIKDLVKERITRFAKK